MSGWSVDCVSWVKWLLQLQGIDNIAMRQVGNKKMWENQMMVIPAAICSVSFTHLSKTNWAEPISIADELAAVMDDRARSILGCQIDPQVQADCKSEQQSGMVNPKLKESSVPNFWGQACSTWWKLLSLGWQR
jgi:hypothetical protein